MFIYPTDVNYIGLKQCNLCNSTQATVYISPDSVRFAGAEPERCVRRLLQRIHGGQHQLSQKGKFKQ